MFDQVVGNGANLFVITVAVLIGFATAIGFINFQKTKREDPKD